MHGRSIAKGIGIAASLVAIALLAGFLWLRTTPYWAGITMFAEGKRVENFRAMDQILPYKTIERAGTIWALVSDPRPLPESYRFDGEMRDLNSFLERTVTTGFLVVAKDTIIHEDYRLGADQTSPFTSWSVAKSIVSALIGIAIDEGHIGSVQDPIARYVPALVGTAYGKTTIEDALTMSSGIDFDENYDDALSDVNMLFVQFATGEEIANILAPLAHVREPGTYNNYISSDTLALGLVLEHATGMDLSSYMASRLWAPLGAEADAFWNTSRADTAIAMCCLNAILRDYARFGRLYLEDGARDGVQIVPSAWVQASVTTDAPHLRPGDNPASFWTFGYGYQWWIPEDPQGDFVAIGIWGQYIYVNPTHDVVIVKASADPRFDDHDHESIAVFRTIAAAISD